MIKKYGIEEVERMLYDNKTYKIHDYELEEMIQHYTIECCKIAYVKGINISKYFSKKILSLYYK